MKDAMERIGLARKLRGVAAAGRFFWCLPLPGSDCRYAGRRGEFYVLLRAPPLRLRIEGIKPVTGGFDLAGIEHDPHRQL